MPAAGASARGVRVKALVTGAAGFIGSHSAEALVAQGADVVGRGLLHRLLRAGDQGTEPRGAAQRAELHVRRRRAADARLGAPARRRDACVPPGGAGRRAEELGRRLPDLHAHNVDATQRLLEAVKGGRCTGSCTPRARRSTATRRRSRCARTRTCSRSRPTASPSWRPSTCATCTRELRRAGGVAAVLHRVRPAAAARHGVSPVHPRRPRPGSRSRSTATASRRATSPSWPTSSRPTWRRATAARPGPSITSAAGSRVSVNQVLDLIGRLTGRPLEYPPGGDAKGRHAGYFCGHVSRPGGPGIRARRWTLEAGLAAECDWLRLAGPDLIGRVEPGIVKGLRFCRLSFVADGPRGPRACRGRAGGLRRPSRQLPTARSGGRRQFLYERGTGCSRRRTGSPPASTSGGLWTTIPAEQPTARKPSWASAIRYIGEGPDRIATSWAPTSSGSS